LAPGSITLSRCAPGRGTLRPPSKGTGSDLRLPVVVVVGCVGFFRHTVITGRFTPTKKQPRYGLFGRRRGDSLRGSPCVPDGLARIGRLQRRMGGPAEEPAGRLVTQRSRYFQRAGRTQVVQAGHHEHHAAPSPATRPAVSGSRTRRWRLICGSAAVYYPRVRRGPADAGPCRGSAWGQGDCGRSGRSRSARCGRCALLLRREAQRCIARVAGEEMSRDLMADP